MKIIVTGSLGNISKPLAEELVRKGHTVVVITSKPEKQTGIEALGAIAAIGTLEDADLFERLKQKVDTEQTQGRAQTQP